MRGVNYFIFIVVGTSLSLCAAESPDSTGVGHYVRPRMDIPAWHTEDNDSILIERHSFGDYVFESVGVYEHARFTISRKGQVLFVSEKSPEYVHYYRAGYRAYARVGSGRSKGPLSPVIPMGADITGDGVPNLLVTRLRDGNAGVWSIDIFDIGEEFRHIQHISEYNGDLHDINGTGAMEFVFGDGGFAYLPVYTGGGNAYIPYPTIVLSYQNDAFKLNTDFMRKEAPTEVDLKKLADEIKTVWPAEGVQLGSAAHSAPIEFVGKIIAFVYEGNLNAAHYLERNAVPEYARDGVMTAILPDIYKEIESSRYADELLRMNGADAFWPRQK